MLAYLAVEARQPHTRAHMCALLWPNTAERAAHHRAQHNRNQGDAAIGALGEGWEEVGDLAGARVRQQEALRLRVESGERRGVDVALPA